MDKGLLVVTTIYLVMVALLLPLREVGYQDDFAYHHAVRNVLQTGVFKNHESVAASFLFQEAWGILFSMVFGFSYKTLQLSTIVLMFFGVLAFYATLRELRIGEVKSILCTGALFLYPQILRYTFTFMTNVPYLALELVALYFGVLFLKRVSWRWGLVSSLVAMAAFLVRNLGVFIPVALGLAFAAKSVTDRKLYLKEMLAVFFPALSVFVAYTVWFNQGNMTAAQYEFVYQPLEQLRYYLLPTSLALVASYKQVYLGYVHKLATFVTILLGMTTPFLLCFRVPPVAVLKRNHRLLLLSGFIGIVSLTPFAINLLLDYGIKMEGAYQQSYLPFAAPNSWGSFLFYLLPDVRLQRWLILVSYMFVPASVLVTGYILLKVQRLYVQKRKRISYAVSIVVLMVNVAFLFLFVNGIRYAMAGRLFGFYVAWAVVAVISIYSLFFQIKRNHTTLNFIFLFFLLVAAAHILLTTVYRAYAFEHMFPVHPIVLLFFAWAFNRVPLHPGRTALVAIGLLLISLIFVRRDYQIVGISWEEYARWVEHKTVIPQNVIDFSWAWKPYYFYEPGFTLQLAKVGDKKNIGLHTWWDAAFDRQTDKPVLYVDDCKTMTVTRGASVIHTFHEKSLFIDTEFCSILYPPGIDVPQ